MAVIFWMREVLRHVYTQAAAGFDPAPDRRAVPGGDHRYGGFGDGQSGISSLLAQGGQIGVFGVWVAMTIDWMVRAVVFIIRLLSGRWKKRRLV